MCLRGKNEYLQMNTKMETDVRRHAGIRSSQKWIFTMCTKMENNSILLGQSVLGRRVLILHRGLADRRLDVQEELLRKCVCSFVCICSSILLFRFLRVFFRLHTQFGTTFSVFCVSFSSACSSVLIFRLCECSLICIWSSVLLFAFFA